MQLSVGNSKDPTAGRLTVIFQTGNGFFATGGRHCDEVVLSCGETPSYALVPIPLANFGPGHWDEVAPSVALQTSGPAGALKLRTPAIVKACIGSVSVPVLNGYAVTFTHNIGEDSVIAEIYDARWVLGKFTCFGRLVWDPSTNQVYWDLASDLVYNALGYPDCLDHPKLGPVHAPCHRFGYKNDFSDWSYDTVFEDFSEPAPGQATTRARSWRSQDAARDLRRRFYPTSVAPKFPVTLGSMDLPSEIIWPESIGACFGADRPLKDCALSRNGSSMSLSQALQKLARHAGPFDLYVDPGNDGISTLGFCDMSPKSGTGTRLITAQYAASLGEAVTSPIVVKGGTVQESIVNVFDEVNIMGDAPAIEMMASMDMNAGSASSGKIAPYSIALEPAWSDADETAFKEYVVKFGRTTNEGVFDISNSKGTAYSFAAACAKWPLVYCAYRIKGGFDLWGLSKWVGMFNGGRPRIKPFQLTGYQQDQSNPRNWQPREIIVEYFDDFLDKYDSDPNYLGGSSGITDNKWHLADRYDNLTLSADGTMIMLTALRDHTVGAFVPAGLTWVSQNTTASGGGGHPSNGTYRGDTMRRRPIRIQLAIEGDWPINSLKGTGGAKADDPNRIYDRVAPTPRFCWQVTSPAGDYLEYLRTSTSAPVGAANLIAITDNAGSFPQKQAKNDELFTDRIDNNTGRISDHSDARLDDVKRVEVHASLEIEQLAPCHKPGMSCSLEGGNTIPVWGVMKTVVLRSKPKSEEEGQTTVIIEPPDTHTIYSHPAGSTWSGGSGPKAAPGTSETASYQTAPGPSSTGSNSASSGNAPAAGSFESRRQAEKASVGAKDAMEASGDDERKSRRAIL